LDATKKRRLTHPPLHISDPATHKVADHTASVAPEKKKEEAAPKRERAVSTPLLFPEAR
jgi:hypothetical protein